MFKKILSTVVLSTTLTFAVQAAPEVSGTVGFTNDYRFHGISQSAGNTAIQGSLDAAFDNGVYIGAWGSNIDFGEMDNNLEIDYYIGYGDEINDDLSYDVFLAYYTYQNQKDADYDYLELDTALFYADFSLKYNYAPDYANSGYAGHYVALEYSHAINDMISLDLHAGHSFGDHWGDYDINEYQDYSVGLSGSVSGLDISLSYLMNSVDSDQKTSSGAFRNDDAFVVSVSRSF